jgi:peptidoglycan/xylan/chitin deacetylase (PgdA/CDA1 family)
LMFCTGIGLVGAKLVASFWIPAWGPPFYLLSGVLGIIGIGKLAVKAIRLGIAEFRLRRTLIVLHPLSAEGRQPLTRGWAALQTIWVVIVCALLSGGVWYAQAHPLLPSPAQTARACVAELSPMPKVPNDVPALNTWHTSGSATFGSTLTGGFLGAPSLTITNATETAAWAYAPQLERAGTAYQYADWYSSDIQTSLVIEYALDGVTKTQTIDAAIPATTGWRHYSAAFKVPGDPGPLHALPVTVMHQVTGIGTLELSDVMLHQQTNAFVRPLISLTFDDGWRSQYTNALPILCQYKTPATFYLVSKYVKQAYPGYLRPDMVSQLAESGMEIGDHTVDHQSLLLLSSAAVQAEISDSKAYLEQFGPVVDFASPYGAASDEDIQLIKQIYQSHRGTDVGVNTADGFDAYNLMCVTIDANEQTGSFAQIKPYLDLAIKTNAWLILAFHQVAAPGEKYATDPYNTSPALLGELLSYIEDHHLQPMTINQGLSEVYQQI